jgi:ABC-type glycerol-3-phosphate transport system substrate-binding protein
MIEQVRGAGTRRWTRRAALAAGGALTAALAVACGPLARRDGAGQQTPTGPQRLVVWVPGAGNPSYPPAFEEFLKRNPGWTGELVESVNFQKFQTSIAGGDVPDAYFAQFDTIQVAAHKGMFAPLDKYISRDKVNMESYFFGSRAGAVYKGKYYGMPHHSNVRSVYVNQRLLRNSGMNPDAAPASWDDFRNAIQRLGKVDAGGAIERVGYNPIWAIGGTTMLFYFQANGVPLVNNDGTQPGFATPAGIEALKWLQDTVNAIGGVGAYAEFQKKFRNVGEAIAKDAIGMSLLGVWILGQQIFPADPTVPIAQWPMPGGPSAKGKQFGFFNATCCTVPTEAPRPEAGWQFAKYQASAEGQRFIQEPEGSFDQACLPDVANNPVVLARQPWRRRANELMAQAKHYAYFPATGTADIQAAITAVTEKLLANQVGPDAAMQEMRQQVQNVMDRYR